MAVVLEAYVNGVSTRKVDRLVEQLGIEGMTKDRVSAMCPALAEQVELFRQRPLEDAYPYRWLDANQVKVRDHGRVVSKALPLATAIRSRSFQSNSGNQPTRLMRRPPISRKSAVMTGSAEVCELLARRLVAG